MDLGITGLIDILIIVLGILVIVIGYLRGFMNKALSIVGVIVIFAFSIMFCGQLAGLFKSSGFIYNSLNSAMLNKVEGHVEVRFAVTIEKSFNIHPAVATIIAFIFGNPPKNLTAGETAEILAEKATIGISFLIIFAVLSIGLIVLKIISSTLRQNEVLRKIDGVFGIFLYLVLYAIFLMVVFFVIDLIYKYGGITEFNQWLEVDLALDSNKFRIGKYLLDNNFLVQIINLFM